MIDPSQQEADAHLLQRVASGDAEAFSALYDRMGRPLFAMAFQILGDAGDAEDALQDSCLQIWKRASSYDASRSSVFSWAVMMTRSKAIDRLRARGRRQRVVAGSTDENPETLNLASEADDAADTSVKTDEAARVRSALGRLTSDQRRSIELAFFSDLTHAEIAERSGEPLGTVKARIRRGLLRLRDGLQ
ncbi:MAG: sigma-70 family RNA polymerase sigma factor [Chthoniobacterales bacterium]